MHWAGTWAGSGGGSPGSPHRPRSQAHCACRWGPPSRRGRCRRRSPRCPRRCLRSGRGWAGSCCSWLKAQRRGPLHPAPAAQTATPPQAGRASGEGSPPGLTEVAGAALPAGRAGAAEGVAAVVAGAAVAAGVGVALELACGHRAAQGAPRSEGGRRAGAGRALTRVAGLALPAVVARAVEVVDQVVAAAAAVAGIGEAVVGIWGRGRRSAGGRRHPGRAARGGGPGAGGRGREAGKDARPRPELLVGPQVCGAPYMQRRGGGTPGRPTHWCHRARPPSR